MALVLELAGVMACKELSPDVLLLSRFPGWLACTLDLRRARTRFYKERGKSHRKFKKIITSFTQSFMSGFPPV